MDNYGTYGFRINLDSSEYVRIISEEMVKNMHDAEMHFSYDWADTESRSVTWSTGVDGKVIDVPTHQENGYEEWTGKDIAQQGLSEYADINEKYGNFKASSLYPKVNLLTPIVFSRRNNIGGQIKIDKAPLNTKVFKLLIFEMV